MACLQGPPLDEVYRFRNDHLVSVGLVYDDQQTEAVISTLIALYGPPTDRITRELGPEFAKEFIDWHGTAVSLHLERTVVGPAYHPAYFQVRRTVCWH